MTPITLTKPVGERCPNVDRDVRAVQTRLNELAPPHLTPLSVDGKCGKLTIGRICDFQWAVCGIIPADGVITPGRTTHRKLNEADSRRLWSSEPPKTTPTPAATNGAPSQDARISATRAILDREGFGHEFDLFRRALVDEVLPAVKMGLAIHSRADEIDQFARIYVHLRKAGIPPDQIARFLKKAVTIKKQSLLWAVLDDAAKPAGKFGKLFKSGGTAAAKIGLAVVIIESADKFVDGDYLYWAAELYKVKMGVAIPWAGILEAVQSMAADAVGPQVKAHPVWQVMRACDPIGLGATGVDAITTLALGSIHMLITGKANINTMMPYLERLVTRIKSGPAGFFASMGEDMGDAMYEISRWNRGDWSYAIKSVPNWFK